MYLPPDGAKQSNVMHLVNSFLLLKHSQLEKSMQFGTWAVQFKNLHQRICFYTIVNLPYENSCKSRPPFQLVSWVHHERVSLYICNNPQLLLLT